MSSNTADTVQPHRTQSDLNGPEDLLTFLVAVPEALEDQNEQVEGLEERVEERFETVDDLARAQESLIANLLETEREVDTQRAEIEVLHEEVNGLRDDLKALRGLFSDRVLEEEDAHVSAQNRDALEIVEVGDTRSVVIDDTDYKDSRSSTAVTHIEGLVTFVPAPAEDLAEGDEVEVRIADVGDRHANTVRVKE